jgi:hypothetical protein
MPMPSSRRHNEVHKRKYSVMSHDSIGASLERRRLEHRVARLRAALLRLQRVAEQTTEAGREVPVALRAAEATFTQELAEADAALRRLDPPLQAHPEGA